MISLRPYREADLPALHALDQVCFAPGIAYSRTELAAFLVHPSSFTAVAVEEEAIAGFAIVRTTRVRSAAALVRRYRPALHLLTIDVAPQMRRRGAGGLLMSWVLAKAANLSVKAIVLEVAVDNLAAQRFYEQFGFTQTAVLPGYYNAHTDALQLERILAEPPRRT